MFISIWIQTESLQTYRISLLAAASETTASCRHSIVTGISTGKLMLEQLAQELSILWANLCLQREELELHITNTTVLLQTNVALHEENGFVKISEVQDELPEASEGVAYLHVHIRSKTSVGALKILERLVKSMGCFVMNQKLLQSTLESSQGQVIGSLFVFNCNEILGAVVRLGHECKRKVTATLHALLRYKIVRLNEQLDKHMSFLATQLSDISPEQFAHLESLVEDYKSDHCALLSDLDILQGTFCACESLFVDLLDTDARAYWSVHQRVQILLEEAQLKERCLVDAKPSVVAGVRSEQVKSPCAHFCIPVGC